MQEAEGITARVRQRFPIVAHCLEQGQSADHVGLDEGARAFDRTIDMAFGREVQHRVRLMFLQQASHERAVADVALDEDMVGIAFQRRQRVQIARISERVEIDHADPARDRLQNKISADEAGPAGY